MQENNAQMKDLYIERQIIGIGLDDPIFRILSLEDFIYQVSCEKIILSPPRDWSLDENPLEDKKFKYDSLSCNLPELKKYYFAVCWTKKIQEDRESWKRFSKGSVTIRIKTTPRKLLASIMHIEDDYFMLNYYIGPMKYPLKEELEKWKEKTPVEDHLDSLGHAMFQSFLLLPHGDYTMEEEVRLICRFKPEESNFWVKEYVHLDQKNRCEHPFIWASVVDEIFLGTKISSKNENELNECLKKYGLQCTVNNSRFRYPRP